MANAAADSLVREPPQATTVTPDPEAEGLHQPRPLTTTRPSAGPVLHCTTVHSSSSLPTLTPTAEHRNSFPLLTGSPPLSDPTLPSAGSLGERLRVLARDMGYPLPVPPSFLEPSMASAEQISPRPPPPSFLLTGSFAYPPGPHGEPPWVNGEPPRINVSPLATASTARADATLDAGITGSAPHGIAPPAVPAWLTSALAWPEFAALRGAAGGTNMSKFRRLAGFLITSARVAFAAALIEVGQEGALHSESSTAKAAAYYTILSAAASGSDRGLQDGWHWPEAAAITLERFAARLIGGPELYAIAAPPLPAFDPDELRALASQGPASAFEHRLPFFFAALACGWPLQVALDLFGTLGEGAYTENGCCFCVAGTDAPDANAQRHVFTADGFLDGITLWTRDKRIIRIITTRSMAGRRAFLSTGPPPEQGFLPPIIRSSAWRATTRPGSSSYRLDGLWISTTPGPTGTQSSGAPWTPPRPP